MNTRLEKQVINAVEFFYDNAYKRSEIKQLQVLGEERFRDEDRLIEMAEGEQFAPKPFEDLIDPQIVAVSQRQEYVVVFGVGASYVVEAPDMYESPGGSYINNAFALVDLSGRRPLIEKFIVGREKDTKIKLLKKHLEPQNFQHFNDRALRKDHREENLNMSYLESRDYGSTERDDPEEYRKMREMDSYVDREFDEAYDQYSKLYEEIEIFDPDEGEYERWKGLGLNALKKEIKKLSERLERLNTERALLNLSSETY